MSVIGPDFVALQVRDLESSKRFYLEKLGFELALHSPPGAVVFATLPIPLAIRQPVRPLPPTGPLGIGLALWIACDNADSTYEALSQRGIAAMAAPTDGPFGRYFVVQDPDGYMLTFHTRSQP